MKNEDILAEVDRRFTDQKDLIDAKFTHLSAIIQSGFDLAHIQRGDIIHRQDEANHRTAKLEKKTQFICWINENKKLATIGLIVIIFIIDFATDNIEIKELIDFIK